MLKIRFGPEKNKVLLCGCETDIADIDKPNMMQVRSKVDFPGLWLPDNYFCTFGWQQHLKGARFNWSQTSVWRRYLAL